MNTVDTALDEQLDAILDDMNWGYQFQMSDYAGSRAQEKEYEAAGLEEIATAKREIKALIRSLTNEAELRGRQDTMRRITEELANSQSIEINEDDTGVNYYYTVRNVEDAIERVANHTKSVEVALLKLSGASSLKPERSQESKPRKEGQ